ELLLHVGIDTVALNGEGFHCQVRKGDRVRAGDVLLRFDLDALATRARSLMTPVIVTNPERFRVARARLDRAVGAGEALFELEQLGDADAPPAQRTGDALISEAVVV